MYQFKVKFKLVHFINPHKFVLGKQTYKGKEINAGLLLNYAIGQYDTYTTLQLSQYVSTIANGGTRYKIRFLKGINYEIKLHYVYF